MKRVLMITAEESLGSGLETASSREGVEFEHVEDWETARDSLVDQPYEAVCIDYESVKIEGLNSFVQLDNILQKEQTQAVIVLRDASPRASQFVDTLESFSATIDLSQDTAADFRSELFALLDAKPDPDESRTEAAAPRKVEVVLPDVSRGDLEEVSVARVVHTLRRQELTGRLELSNEGMNRDFELVDGELLGSQSTVEKLQAAFAWTGGRFQFETDDSLRGSGSEPYGILLRGARNHLDQRDAMDGLMPVMQKYVARTTFFENWTERDADWVDDEALAAFVEEADGETTLEEGLSAIASRVLTGFQAGFFAIECDLVALTDEPAASPVEVTFSSPETSAREQASGGREGVSPSGPGVEESTVEPTTEERESELRRTYERMSDADPYEVFDLWEGCGESVVRERFYKLVQRHHPDSYGGNISDEAKELAEKTFIIIKDAHAELLRAEDEQLVSRSEALESSTSGSSLDESLTSPSVTAMGSGSDEEESSTSEEPAAETAEMTASGEAPQSKRGTGSEEPRYDAERTSDGSDDEGDRAEKLNRLRRNRSDTDQGRSQRKTPFKPGVRREKLASLRKNPDKEKASKVERFEPPESEEEAQEYFNVGYRAYKDENQAKAKTLFERAHQFDPDNPLWKTFYAYTMFLVDSDQRDRAEKLLREALESDDAQARPDAHLFLGRILKVKDSHKRARKHFEAALELNPDSIEAKRELRVYEMRDDEHSDSEESDGFFENLLNKDIF